MKIFFGIMIIILMIIFIELDRTYIIPHTIQDYYYQNFPKQLIYGLHNTIYKLCYSNIIYCVKDYDFHKFLLDRKLELQQHYYQNIMKPIYIYAHKTSDKLDHDTNYKYIPFKFKDKIYPKNMDAFPIIKQLLIKYHTIKTCFISIMEQKKHIPYHRGPSNLILRYHFPIIMLDSSKCYLEVMGIKLYYHQAFLFDDTYPHQLVKLDDSLRVVLICDIDNPYKLI